nr:monooxygenase 2-like [Ipomoea batatas]
MLMVTSCLAVQESSQMFPLVIVLAIFLVYLLLLIGVRKHTQRGRGMEMTVDIVIVGGGIAGLATSLGLHRLGLQSLVLESSESLRVTGFALTLWTNAWRALDALGIADSLRQHSLPITELVLI